MVKFSEVNKQFLSLQAINYFVAYIHHWIKANKFQLEVSDNKCVFFFYSSNFMDSLKSINGPQVKNGCSNTFLQRNFIGEYHHTQIEDVCMLWSRSICGILHNTSKTCYCFYGVIFHLCQEKLCSTWWQVTQLPKADNIFIQLYKRTQCSNFHAKGIQFCIHVVTLIYSTTSMLEVYQMCIVHITHNWMSEPCPLTMLFQNLHFSLCQHYPPDPSSNIRIW